MTIDIDWLFIIGLTGLAGFAVYWMLNFWPAND
jgi:hypothetical protein